jgi:sec-independent protein translocase protein TatB
MFGIGGQELVLLMIIGLVVLGPERLPRIANQIGGWLGQARRMTRVMKRQLEEELDLNKAPTIKPPPALREPSQQPLDPLAQTQPRDDDEFSPAHGEDDIGTGVGEEAPVDEPDLVVTESESSVVDTADDEPAPMEDDPEEKPDEKKEPS